MEDSDFLILDLPEDSIPTPSPQFLPPAQANQISHHSTKSYAMYKEIFKVCTEFSTCNETDLDGFLKNAKEAVLSKFKLECEREEELCSLDLSYWITELGILIEKFNLRNPVDEKRNSEPERTHRFRRIPRRKTAETFYISQLLASFCACTISDSDLCMSDIYQSRARTRIPKRNPTFQSYVGAESEMESIQVAAAEVKMRQLLLQLAEFEKIGVPKLMDEELPEPEMPTSISPLGRAGATKLELALLELAESEVAYLKQLRFIIQYFLGTLNHLLSTGVLVDTSPTALFSNIEQIYKANRGLWVDGIQILIVGKISRCSHKPNAFLYIDEICHPYTKYCLDQESCLNYYLEKSENDDHFKTFVTWFENRPECNRLKIKDLMASPFQRITKYALLLKAIMNFTGDMRRRMHLEKMVTAVTAFVEKINSALKEQQDANET